MRIVCNTCIPINELLALRKKSLPTQVRMTNIQIMKFAALKFRKSEVIQYLKADYFPTCKLHSNR